MKKSLLLSLICLLVLIPATLYLGTRIPGRMYYITGTLMILEAMLPFFLLFEGRRPQARELVLLAVLCALAVVSRVAIQVPNFKPTVGIIMIAGMALGAESGFLTGAVTALASNFFFSQGPWTPWQMMAYGAGGFLAGLLFHNRRLLSRRPLLGSIVLAMFGFVSVVGVVGPLLDCSTLFTVGAKITWRFARRVFEVGLIHNVPHAIATAITLLLLSRPLLGKLARIQKKYGLLE